MSLWEILAAGDGGRSARVWASGRKGPMEDGGRSANKGGRNGEEKGQSRGEAKTGRRKTTARGRTKAETGCRRRGQDQYHVSNYVDWVERRKRDGQEDRDDASKGWSATRPE